MEGLQRFFLRLTPILMLICFICFGITHVFDRNETKNLTYLTHQVTNVGTQQDPNYITIYNFDVESYVNNLDIEILERATTNTIDFQTFRRNINAFNNIWKDGYDFLDISATILNGVILVVNSIITIVDCLIVPWRISAGILLTGLSILGINIDRNTPILTMLNGMLDVLNIPLIPPVGEEGQITAILAQTTWQWNNQLDTNTTPQGLVDIFIPFKSNNMQYIGFRIQNNDNLTVKYLWLDNNNVIQDNTIAYTNGQWYFPLWKTIEFNNENVSLQTGETMLQWLTNNATKIN